MLAFYSLDQGMGSEVVDDPFDALEGSVAEVDGERAEHDLEVPGDGVEGLVGVGSRLDGRVWPRNPRRGRGGAGVDGSAAGGAGAVGVDGGGREEAVAGRAPGHGLI